MIAADEPQVLFEAPVRISVDGQEKDAHRFSYTLSCGCTLRHAIACDVGANEPRMKAMAQFWVQSRALRHQCSLVSGDNPNGLTPKR